MGNLDWTVIALYFILIFGVAFYVTWKDKQRGTPQDYFLAGKNVGWFVVGASLFASNIGSEHLVGLAGSGASRGVAVAQYEILAGFMLVLLGWVFVPFYLASGVFTMPEFLERRYSSGPRTYLAVISIIGYVLTKISVTIAAGGIVFETLMGLNFWTGALIVVVATGIYTAFGGLRAVLYTDMVQMFLLIGGAIAVTVIGVNAVGGWEALKVQAGSEHFNLWKPMSDPEFPWTGIIFGAPILGVWYWCTDQFIVQRVLSAKDGAQARKGTIFAAFLKQTPLFIFVLPGIVAYVMAKSGQLELGAPDQALAALIGALLPDGVRGLVAAGLLAALMSSLSSVFNSCSTLFTMDIYRRLKPGAGSRELVVVGQIAVAVLVLFGLAWIPFMKNISGQLFTYLQSVQAYISPPIAAVFLVGILWPRANAKGAIASLSIGFILGVTRLVLEIYKTDLSGVALELASINFLHIAMALFLICVLVLVVVSLTTAVPDRAQLEDLTWGTLSSERRDPSLALSRGRDLIMTGIVIALIILVWVTFTG